MKINGDTEAVRKEKMPGNCGLRREKQGADVKSQEKTRNAGSGCEKPGEDEECWGRT